MKFSILSITMFTGLAFSTLSSASASHILNCELVDLANQRVVDTKNSSLSRQEITLVLSGRELTGFVHDVAQPTDIATRTIELALGHQIGSEWGEARTTMTYRPDDSNAVIPVAEVRLDSPSPMSRPMSLRCFVR